MADRWTSPSTVPGCSRPTARRRPLAVALMAAMVVVGTQALIVVPVAAKAAAVKELPALASEPAPAIEPRIATGDFTNPPPVPGAARGAEAAPESFDPATSAVVDAETSPTRKAWDNADGTTTVEVSKAERRFLDGATWRDIDMTLERGADGALRAKAAPSSAMVGARADDGVSFDTKAGPIVLRHPDATAVGARTEGPHATYPQALAGRDLTVALNPDGFEETVTVPSRDMAATYVDELVLPAGVSLRQAGEGVELVDRDGTVIAGFGGGLAFDSAPQPSMAPVAVRRGRPTGIGPVPAHTLGPPPRWWRCRRRPRLLAGGGPASRSRSWRVSCRRW